VRLCLSGPARPLHDDSSMSKKCRGKIHQKQHGLRVFSTFTRRCINLDRSRCSGMGQERSCRQLLRAVPGIMLLLIRLVA
jgi:hypothetical protein